MDVSCVLHKCAKICYNMLVPQGMRDAMLFDIGGRHRRPAIGPKSCEGAGQNPATGESRKRTRRPRRVRNSVLMLPGKPLPLADGAGYGVAPHGKSAAQPFSLFHPGS